MPLSRKSTPAQDTPFRPFADEASVETLGGLSIENGGTRIAIHGSLDLTRDRQGLARARRLKALIDTIVADLEGRDLPETTAEDVKASALVRNPFA